MVLVVIVFDMGLNSSKKFKARSAGIQIDVFIFNGFPKAIKSDSLKIIPPIIKSAFYQRPHLKIPNSSYFQY